MQLSVDGASVERFRESLERCASDPTFFHRFYARFLLSSDEVQRRFERVDMRRQESVLRSSLYLVARAASGLEDGLQHLEEIARSHAAKGYGVEPRHYEHWLEALLTVVSETDPRYDQDVHDAWRSTLGACIHAMIGASGG